MLVRKFKTQLGFCFCYSSLPWINMCTDRVSCKKIKQAWEPGLACPSDPLWDCDFSVTSTSTGKSVFHWCPCDSLKIFCAANIMYVSNNSIWKDLETNVSCSLCHVNPTKCMLQTLERLKVGKVKTQGSCSSLLYVSRALVYVCINLIYKMCIWN